MECVRCGRFTVDVVVLLLPPVLACWGSAEWLLNGGDYELKSRTPSIKRAKVLATMNRFRMMSPTY